MFWVEEGWGIGGDLLFTDVNTFDLASTTPHPHSNQLMESHFCK